MNLNLALTVSVVFFWNSVLAQNGSDPFTFDDFLSGRYGQRGFGGIWISDSELQYRGATGDLIVWNVVTNASSVLVPAVAFSNVSADSYSISPDRRLVLMSYDTQAQFRHSTTAKFVIYNINDKTYENVANGAFLQIANWGPVGRSLIYVLDNNVFYSSDITLQAPVQVTDSGIPGVVYNAVPDWVYEEEVLGTGTAYWFSADGKYLIYLEFNDEDVPEMSYFRYGAPGTLEDQYPEQVKIRYPKAGAVNPEYKSYLVNLTDPSLPRTLISEKQDDGVMYGYFWTVDNLFAELSMSRVQNESWLNIYSSNLEKLNTFSWESPKGWITLGNNLVFDSSSNYVLSIESRRVGSSGNYSHLVIRDIKQGNVKDLTSGEFVVLSIIGWDETNKLIYYSATEEGRPSGQQLFVVSSDGGDSTCISCSLTSPEGNRCTSASAKISSSYTYLVLTCSAPDPITVALYKNEKTLGDPLLVIEDNASLRSALKQKSLPTQFDTTVEVDGGFLAQVRLQLPRDFDESRTYPLLINVYAGPDSNQIIDGFSLSWGTYLTSDLNVIYGYIDGRGSGRKGDDMLFAGYRTLGTVEIYDQINVTRELQARYPWIDRERTAIWGWSYGGYATGRTLELDTGGVFKCGISVAPVTSWLYYDSVYTERYMGLPTADDNLVGYQDGDLVSNVENLKKKKYYLIHGNADDNVHYQQSMMLSRALELDDVLFQQQSYPDENHSLGGVSRHLYHSMDKFWKDCFLLQ